jgi:RNA polymerase sigma factor (sigma-70 family)
MPSLTDLVDAHSAALYTYLWRLTRDPQAAEDHLQETFLRAHKAWAKVQAHPNPRAWLYRTATNLARSAWQKQKRFVDELDNERPSGEFGIPEQIAQREQLRAIARAVEALPPQQRAALILRQYQDFDYANIAAALHCTEPTARAHVSQALKKLRKALGGSE